MSFLSYELCAFYELLSSFIVFCLAFLVSLFLAFEMFHVECKIRLKRVLLLYN